MYLETEGESSFILKKHNLKKVVTLMKRVIEGFPQRVYVP